ncbi:hypothetical protein NQ176_g1833 [Zarea fungicola]|uniref:Uncharacterized protein n=1 Tax=Zarea fungicola TaxID=93591 RepID=A0ACC1NTU1_9HYPO|nr:hypothetical protein NQ176_g1833 [Lecanicillium fungicola]
MKLLFAIAGAILSTTPLTGALAPYQAHADIARGLGQATVKFPGGTVIGRSLLGVESFAAIPFAEPPIGPLRLRPPKRFNGTLTDFDGTGTAPACPQMGLAAAAIDLLSNTLPSVLNTPLFAQLTGQEDCLSVTIQRPAGTAATDKLPVLFWMFGGGFELGSTSSYDATSLLNTATSQDQPFVFVAVNYRLNGFGFLPGAEVLRDGSANLGLLDQRMALEWVADNIAAFGGDPAKVTIWGESAGSISVFLQMLLFGGNATYNGEPLFRGAIMNSGSTAQIDPVDCPKAQAIYDTVVNKAGCTNSPDTLNCLRQVSYQTFYDAVTSVPGILSYNALALSYLPRPDGTVLPDSPGTMASKGEFYAVPMIIGDQEDEGSLFAAFTNNIPTSNALVDYLSTVYFPTTPRATVEELVSLYPNQPPAGSPFRTGYFHQLYPGFKRVAALLGDVTFTLARRMTLQAVSPVVPTWSYLSSYDYVTPGLGTFHGSDILQVFLGIPQNYAMQSCRTYYLNFLLNLDPNEGVGGYMPWPRWTEGQNLMWFKSGYGNGLLKDDFRKDVSDWLATKGAELFL